MHPNIETVFLLSEARQAYGRGLGGQARGKTVFTVN